MAKKRSKEEQINYWLQEHFNPKAHVVKGEPRLGRRYNIETEDEEGRPTYWTNWVSLDTLHELVWALVRYNIFAKIKEV